MFVTLTPNPSLDKTGEVTEFRSDDVNRLRRVSVRAGGKGVNVARVLTAFGRSCVCMGFLGGVPGAEMESLLKKEGIRVDFTRIADNTRTNWAILERNGGQVFKINEPGPVVRAAEIRKLLAAVTARFRQKSRILILCGSLPDGAGAELYRKAVSAVRRKNRMVVLDTDGDGLRIFRGSAGQDRPNVIKPNLFEAERMLGRSVRTDSDIIRAVLEMGSVADRVLLTAGRNGVYFEEDGAVWNCVSRRRSKVTIPGAGDAFLAGFVMGLADGRDVFGCVKRGTAIAAASCARGDFCTPADAKAFGDSIVLRRIPES